VTGLNAAESTFVTIAEDRFGFLPKAYSCVEEVLPDAEGVTVRFRNGWLAVELQLEDDERIFASIVPLADGQLPARFDSAGHEKLTRFPLDDLVALYDPSWRPPGERYSASSADDLLAVLTQYAAALEQHGGEVLRGDREPFKLIERDMRQRLILTYLEDWALFVDRVRRGFTGGIGEYTSGVTSRGQLEDVLRSWAGDANTDPRAQLEQLDAAFDGATQPVPTEDGDPLEKQFSVVPGPNAMRWWRRPKHLVGSLREYFLARSR
jgi:hypothetical protein